MRKNLYILLIGMLLAVSGLACGGEDNNRCENGRCGDETDGDVDGDADGDQEDVVSDGDETIDPDGDEEPEDSFNPICKTPEPLGEDSYFTDVTDEMGIGVDGLALVGNRIESVDLDNDGYPDLIVHVVSSNARDDFEADPPRILKRILLNRQDPNNRFKRVFIDVTDESGYSQIRGGGLGRAAHFAVFGDIDNDGALDCFSATYVDANNRDTDPGDRSEILLGDGEGKFSLAKSSDTTPSSGNAWSTTAASLLDYDRDGNLDLWVGFWYKRYGYLEALQNRLYKGNGKGRFKDVTEDLGLTTTTEGYEKGTNHKPTYGATICDVNDDGNPDLLASSYGRQFNELWLNEGDSFTDLSLSSGFASDDVVDFSDNEFYKCYCTVRECDPDPGTPRTQCPTPADSYWGASDEEAFRLGGNTFTTLCGDWTGDGLPDIFNAEIQHWHIGQSSDPSQLLVNESDGEAVSFTRPGREATGLTRRHVGVDWNEGDISAVRFDFDNDGFPDLYIGNSDYPYTYGTLFRQTANGQFVEVSDESGTKHSRANGLTFADFDRDGDLDLVVASSLARESPWDTAEVHIYRNDVGHRSNAVRITLIGKGEGYANVSGIGARVKVKTGERTQTEWVQGGFGHFGIQNELPLTIGLGDACEMEELEIRWPNSELTVQTFENLPANVHYVIMEGREPIYMPLVQI